MSKRGRPVGWKSGKHPTSINGKKTVMYVKWMGMHQRCYNPKSQGYKFYGGRGITICDRWRGRAGFDNFVDDMGQPQGTQNSIERKNNDGNYEPDNCRWATMSEQQSNRRSTKGQVRDPDSLRQRAIRAGLSYRVVVNRVYYLGWTEERALATPKMKVGRAIGWRKPGPDLKPKPSVK